MAGPAVGTLPQKRETQEKKELVPKTHALRGSLAVHRKGIENQIHFDFVHTPKTANESS